MMIQPAIKCLIGVAIHPAMLSTDALLEQCQVVHGRASGPGGQHRNKVQTAITITHRPTGEIGRASERRSQSQNLAVAVSRLRVSLAMSCRTKAELASDTQGRLQGEMAERWSMRVHHGQLRVNREHDDFPALLAWVLDVLFGLNMEIPAAANLLGISSSQLVRFLRQEPACLAMVNQTRQAVGLGRLQ